MMLYSLNNHTLDRHLFFWKHFQPAQPISIQCLKRDNEVQFFYFYINHLKMCSLYQSTEYKALNISCCTIEQITYVRMLLYRVSRQTIIVAVAVASAECTLAVMILPCRPIQTVCHVPLHTNHSHILLK